jgi:hypothetical protein
VEVVAMFPPALAAAVVRLLRREGVRAATGAVEGDDIAVLVPATERERAFAVLAAGMDELVAAVEAAAAATGDDEEEDAPPLVFERLRRLGFLPLLLAPLLAVTLAAVGLPGAYALIVFVAGVVAIQAWRDRARSNDR